MKTKRNRKLEIERLELKELLSAASGLAEPPAPVIVIVEVAADPGAAREGLEAAAAREAEAFWAARHDASPPHQGDPGRMHEHLAALDLVPPGLITHTAIVDGNWSDPDTWAGRRVPGPGDRAWIMPGRTVTVDRQLDAALETLRVNGTLRFATDRDTLLKVDTLVVDAGGALVMGDEADPIAPHATARIVFADGGPIDRERDPLALGRGLVAHGSVRIHGAEATPYVPLSRTPAPGDTQLHLAEAPVNWKVGDRLALTASVYGSVEEAFTVAAIADDGRAVTLDRPLVHRVHLPDHAYLERTFGQAPDGPEVRLYVANLTRNAVLESENAADVGRRGHVMFMHNPDVQVRNAGFYGLGRTDKSRPIDEAVLDGYGHLVPGTGTNPIGRYAVHFHRTGTDPATTPAEVAGSVVVGSPGWGFVNHSSHVEFVANVAFDVDGAHFVAEAGDEVGSFRGNMALLSRGTGLHPTGLSLFDNPRGDGHAGDGFWLDSAGVAVVGNVVAGVHGQGFFYDTQQAIGNFRDNTVAAAYRGLSLWSHAPATTSVIADSTFFGLRAAAIEASYSADITFDGLRIIGDTWDKVHSFMAIANDQNPNISYDDLYVVGYHIGIDVTRMGTGRVRGGYYNNKVNITVYKSTNVTGRQYGPRTVDIDDVEFGTLPAELMRGETQYDIYMQPLSIAVGSAPPHADPGMNFEPDVIRYDGAQLYYPEQAPDFVLEGTDVPELEGRTNAELWARYRLALGGALAPADAVAVPRIRGLVGRPTDHGPHARMISQPWALPWVDGPDGYWLAYSDARGEVHWEDPIALNEGWNFLTREIDGVRRTFLVLKDTTPPEFEPDPGLELTIAPDELDQGFTLSGWVRNGSYRNADRFVRHFGNLEGLVRPDGTIPLEFVVGDFVGNTRRVVVTLRVVNAAREE